MSVLKGISKAVMTFAVVVGLLFHWGCGDDFLGLEDYQRDLLIGGLAAALLTQQAQDEAQTGDGDSGAQVGRDGADGEDGLSCWDLNANGAADAAEDVNGDGVFDALDCQGPAGLPGSAGADGQSGAPGLPGSDGQDGLNGLECWDLDGDGAGDAAEDRNGDARFDVQDCRGSAGANGSAGADGPEFFDIFIDDFFTIEGAPRGQLPVNLVAIEGPALGIRDVYTGVDGLVGYRVAIPDTYDLGNDVTMRLFLFRTGAYDSDCFVFTVDSRRLRVGLGIEPYGSTRWVQVDSDDGNEGVLLVVDLPVNAVDGLGYADDLADGDLLAFELRTDRGDERSYLLLGVEFFESGSGEAVGRGVTGIFTEQPADCGLEECISDADCPKGMQCVKGMCLEPT